MQSWVYQEGLKKGQAEGEAKGKAESVLRILAAKGLSVSEEERKTILACTDHDTLNRWLEQALNAKTTAELFR
jgi:hypothetical protein